MSIYASLPAPNDDHPVECAIYVERRHEYGGSYYELSGEPCDCGTPDAPIKYQGSHVLPSDDDERGGVVDIALIPGHIDRSPERPPLSDDTRPYHPWLRLGINGERVVLDRRGVALMHKSLGEWLEGVVPEDDDA